MVVLVRFVLSMKKIWKFGIWYREIRSFLLINNQWHIFSTKIIRRKNFKSNFMYLKHTNWNRLKFQPKSLLVKIIFSKYIIRYVSHFKQRSFHFRLNFQIRNTLLFVFITFPGKKIHMVKQNKSLSAKNYSLVQLKKLIIFKSIHLYIDSIIFLVPIHN